MLNNLIFIAIGMVLMVIFYKVKDVTTKPKTKTIESVMLTEEQVRKVQELLESFVEDGEEH